MGLDGGLQNEYLMAVNPCLPCISKRPILILPLRRSTKETEVFSCSVHSRMGIDYIVLSVSAGIKFA